MIFISKFQFQYCRKQKIVHREQINYRQNHHEAKYKKDKNQQILLLNQNNDKNIDLYLINKFSTLHSNKAKTIDIIYNYLKKAYQESTHQVMTYFQTAKRGQLQELQDALNSRSLDDKRFALKKVIAQMTLGKDLSTLFQSVIKCLEHQDLDIKKLVYLYIINYSRVRPDDAIMSINLFRKDATNKSNPMIRALAVRTMSSLRVPKLNEYLVEPLKVALNDEDPYVRKTAVLSVPKVFEIAREDPQTLNLVISLQNLVIKESNALVLANSIASLEQIRIISGRQQVKLDSALLTRLLVAINQCMEWAQVYILDYLCRYDPVSQEQAEMIVDRVFPRLSHINPSVVFGCIKLVVRYFDFMNNQELIKNLIKKIASSIVSIVSFTPTEIQYVILKNIQYIIEKRPSVLENQIKCFFCKFTDPHYVKIQKIQILVRIVNYKNYQTVLQQLKQYLNQVDSQFVKKCIKAISKIAIRYEGSIDKCMGILAKQIKDTRSIAEHAQNVVNELLTATQNILRKYPSRYNYDGMFEDLVGLFDYATQPQSKQAAVWILGQYTQQTYEVSMSTFKKWIINFTSEQRIVQLQIISSAVKVYLKYPQEFTSLITDLLTIATQQVDNPDVRDRAFIYWRMLSTDPKKAKDVVFGGYRKQAKDNDKLIDPVFLNQMMKSLGYSSSLFEKLPDELFQKSLAELKGINIEKEDVPVEKDVIFQQQVENEEKPKSLKDIPITTNKTTNVLQNQPKEQSPEPKSQSPPIKQQKNVDLLDLL